METIAYNFHDEDDSTFKNFTLTAGTSKNKLFYFKEMFKFKTKN
jgi:hypothetical protein